jgi:hypothetical protein
MEKGEIVVYTQFHFAPYLDRAYEKGSMIWTQDISPGFQISVKSDLWISLRMLSFILKFESDSGFLEVTTQ